VSLTAKEQKWVQETRDGIMEVVDEFVPASDASRIERDLDLLIEKLTERAS
jgi:hypothetical protein